MTVRGSSDGPPWGRLQMSLLLMALGSFENGRATSGRPHSTERRRPTWLSWEPASVSSGSGIQLGDEAGRSHGPVRLRADGLDLIPVDVAIEAHADPAPAADIGRAEEAVGFGRRQFLLRTR